MEAIKEIFVKIYFSIIVIIIGLIPLWIFLLIQNLLSPEGFWQNIFVYGVGLYFLGAFQFLLLFFLIICILKIWEL